MPDQREDDPVRLLIVDDEEVLLRALSRILRGRGFAIALEQDAVTAVRRIGEERIEIVISDYLMPEMSGIDLLKAIAQRFPDVVTVLMSGSTLESLPTPIMERAGIEHFIEKPWQQNEVHALLRDLEQSVLALRARKRDSVASTS